VGPTVDICKSVNLFCLTRKKDRTVNKTKQNKAKPKDKERKKRTENASAKQQQQKHADRALQQQL